MECSSVGRASDRHAACIDICVHVKDPVVHVRVRWILEKKKTKIPSMHLRDKIINLMFVFA